MSPSKTVILIISWFGLSPTLGEYIVWDSGEEMLLE